MELGHSYRTTYTPNTQIPRANNTSRGSSPSASCATPSLSSPIPVIGIIVESPEDQSVGPVLNKATTNLSVACFVSCRKSSKKLRKSLMS